MARWRASVIYSHSGLSTDNCDQFLARKRLLNDNRAEFLLFLLQQRSKPFRCSGNIDGLDGRINPPDATHHLKAVQLRHLNIVYDQLRWMPDVACISLQAIAGSRYFKAF